MRQPQPHGVDGAFGLGNLGRRHLLKIHAAKMLVHRGCHRHVDLDPLGFLDIDCRWWFRAQRLIDAARRRRRLLSLAIAGQRRQQQVAHLFHQPWIAPEDMKGLIKQQPVLRAFHKTACQRVIEFGTIAKINLATDLDTVQNRCRPDIHTGAAQRTHKMGNVLGKLHAAPCPEARLRRRKVYDCCLRRRHPARYPDISACTSVRIRAASVPVIRPMSS